MQNYKDSLPLSERLSRAYKVVFEGKINDKLSKREKNKGKVEAEIKNQKVNKIVSKSTGNSSDKSSKSNLSTEQLKAIKAMGVTPKQFKKFGKLKF